MSVSELIDSHLGKWNSGWSMGAYGAIGEFHQDLDEPTLPSDQKAVCRVTDRGGIRFNLDGVEALAPIAYATLSPRSHRWNQVVAFCLPKEEARCNQRSVLAELGADSGALLDRNKEDILFDMGLSLLSCDFCIRTSDEELIAVLRENEGRSLFEQGNPAMGLILKKHPHRVSITKAGRVEVFQKIGGPDTNNKSPEGPHTHVLPRMLKSGRTHTPDAPIKDGQVPVAYLHPGNAAITTLGADRNPFDPALLEDFGQIMQKYGSPEANEVTAHFIEAIEAGKPPDTFEEPGGRFALAALRVSMRQQEHVAKLGGNQELINLISQWREEFDLVSGKKDSDDSDSEDDLAD